MQKQTGGELTIENAGFYAAKQGEAPALGGMEILGVGEIQQGMTVLDSYPDLELDDNIVVGGEGQTYCHTHSNSLSNKMDNSLLAVRGINHKSIVVKGELDKFIQKIGDGLYDCLNFIVEIITNWEPEINIVERQ